MDPTIKVAIIGPGNIGADLMYKIRRSRSMDLVLMSRIKPDSVGLSLAKELSIPTSLSGTDAILENDLVQIIFDAIGARPHSQHAPMLKAAGKIDAASCAHVLQTESSTPQTDGRFALGSLPALDWSTCVVA